MTGISKAFGPTRALSGVSLEVRAGEVHALVGENGAGKSTLMKVLSGAYAPDAGRTLLDGKPYAPTGTLDARQRGVAMIYQELTLAPHLSVEANILLGMEPRRWGWLARSASRELAAAALAHLLGHPPGQGPYRNEVRLDTPVGTLGPGAQQLVEIARALVAEARLIVFDEPTSSLSVDDQKHLFQMIRRLKARGVGIVYISHFLEEVQEIADRFTVLRDGRHVGTGRVDEASIAEMIELMVGRALDEFFPRVPHRRGGPILDLRGVRGRPLPRRVDLVLHRGEILGIAGLVGAGRTELLRAVFGLAEVRRGEVRIAGALSTRGTPARRIAEGVGLLSEDRKSEGLAQDQSIADNLTYSRLAPYQRAGWLNLRRRRRAVEGWLERLNVRATDADEPICKLSGGNQQKVALARLLHQEADVLLLDEPTRGIDVASKAEVYQLIGKLAAEGKAILLVSSYLPELLGICDRIAVMTRGVLSPLREASQWSDETIMAVATGTDPFLDGEAAR
jgi:ribose transport system ATP-binding protein